MFVFLPYCTLIDNDRKCFYAANGYIEDLSIAELESCARQESKSMDSFASVGYHFKKQFDGKWFEGLRKKIDLPGLCCINRAAEVGDKICGVMAGRRGGEFLARAPRALLR